MYSDLIAEHFMDPGYVGNIDSPEFEFKVGNSVCGDRIQIQFKTSKNKITQIAYRAWGCATSVATGDIFCESVENQSFDELVSRSNEQMAALLGELDPSQQHCVNIMESLHEKLVAAIG